MTYGAFPSEITVKASAIPPAVHDAMSDGRRFHFKMTQGSVEQLFTAKAEQAEEPGLIRISDIRPTHAIVPLSSILPDDPMGDIPA